MIDEKFIKPIPEYIKKRILSLDLKNCPEQKSLRFYSYLTTIKKELVKITVAIRNKNKKLRLVKQVAVHGVYSDKCLVRDLEYCYFGVCAYRVGWYDEGIRYPYGLRPSYNDGKWYSVPFKYYNPYSTVVNIDFALKVFPYSAVDILDPICPIKYLRQYLIYPQAEYLIKAGLGRFVYSKMILQKIEKDKKFRTWLITNKTQLTEKPYYISVVLRAYRTGKPLSVLQAYADMKISLRQNSLLDALREAFRKDIEKLFDYVSEHETNINAYNDYFKACNYLGLDMTDDKNRFPHDFQRWHDIRSDEYATKTAMENELLKPELYRKFAVVADKYSALQHDKQSEFIAVIAKSPSELIREGELLHHCVGKMNYDQRFIREESLIFFIRLKDSPSVPFVTVEYSLSQRRVLQCYGDKDSKPDDPVLHYVNKIWLPFANKQLKKLTA